MNTNYKKKNNVWSDTLMEESLCSNINLISSFCTNDENKNVIKVNNREIESYEYSVDQCPDNKAVEGIKTNGVKRNHLDIDPSLVNFIKNETTTEVEVENKTKPVKSRLGDLVTFDENKSRSHIPVSEIDSESLVAKEIAKYLKEDNVDLIQRCVKFLGRKKALEILYATEDIQERGGMLTTDGYRKRSPGGVYIQLVRKDDTILNCQRKNIFVEDFLKKKKQKQMKRLVQRKRFERAKEELTKKINGEEVSVKDRLDFPDCKKVAKQVEQDVSIAEDDFDNMEEENLIYFE